MVINKIVKPRTKINEIGKRDITYIKQNNILYSKFKDHPIILSGVIKPNVLINYGINTTENYYIINQVSHKHKDSFHPNFIRIDPNFILGENLGTFDLCLGLYVVPESVLINYMEKNIVYLREKGIDLNQEEISLNTLLAKSKISSDFPVSIYDRSTNSWVDVKIPTTELTFFESMSEKRVAFEKITGNIYADDGQIIHPSIVFAHASEIMPGGSAALAKMISPTTTTAQMAQIAVIANLKLYVQRLQELEKLEKEKLKKDNIKELSIDLVKDKDGLALPNRIDNSTTIDKIVIIKSKPPENGSDNWPSGC